MTFPELKKILEKDLAITIMGVLYSFIKTGDKLFSKRETDDIRFYKVTTKNYHVRIIVDDTFELGIFVKPRGFLKEWNFIDKRKLPEFLAKDIFSASCTKAERKRLVSKIVELKAFW